MLFCCSWPGCGRGPKGQAGGASRARRLCLGLVFALLSLVRRAAGVRGVGLRRRSPPPVALLSSSSFSLPCSLRTAYVVVVSFLPHTKSHIARDIFFTQNFIVGGRRRRTTKEPHCRHGPNGNSQLAAGRTAYAHTPCRHDTAACRDSTGGTTTSHMPGVATPHQHGPLYAVAPANYYTPAA